VAKPRTPKSENAEATAGEPIENSTEVVEAPVEQASDASAVIITPAPDDDVPVVAKEPVVEPEAPAPDESTDDALPEEVAEPESVMAEMPEKPAAAEQKQQRSGFLPLVLGGVVAAGLGAGAVIYALPNLPPAIQALLPQPPQVDEAGLKAAIAAQAAKTDALAADLATIKAAPAPVADMSGVQSALDEAQAAVRAVTEAQAALEARISALEKRPAEGGAVSDAGLAAFQAELDALREQVAQNGAASSQVQEQVAIAAQEAQQRIAEAEAQASKLRAESEAAAQRTMGQAAVARLGAAIDSGAPTAAALADLQAAGVTPPAELSGDVPSLTDLQASFPEAARMALAAARKAMAGDKITDRIGAFLLSQTGARSLEPQEGSGPDAVLSRAQAAVDHGDMAAALGEIATLPDVAQGALADWVAQAKLRQAATDALAALGQSVK
jgi:hypothetical protein